MCSADIKFTKHDAPRAFLAEDVVRVSRQAHGVDIETFILYAS